MKLLIHLLQVLALFLFFFSRSAICSPPSGRSGPTCQNITIPVTISSNNTQLPPGDILNAATIENVLGSLVDLVFDTLVQGTFNIAAAYCEPELHVASRVNTLQLLIHGATYTRNIWSGDGAPGFGYEQDRYSWVSFASKQGYPTLAIDRLGNGLSDHPDPLLVVQNPAHVEVAHAIIELARSGASSLPRAFDRIVLVGHSFGSLISNSLNAKYPADVDATVLTGFSSMFATSLPNAILKILLLPAALVEPKKYGNLPLCYLETSSEPGITNVFYSGSYDPDMASYDFSQRGTITCGELLTVLFTTAVAAEYTAPVYVITGQHDGLFCNPTGSLTPADCGEGSTSMLAQTRSLYPAADVFEWYGVPESGHCWQLHYAAQDGLNRIHAWLGRVGFWGR